MFLHNICLDPAASSQVPELEIYTDPSTESSWANTAVPAAADASRKTSCCNRTTASSFYLGASCEGLGQVGGIDGPWWTMVDLSNQTAVLAGTTTPMTRHCSRWGHSGHSGWFPSCRKYQGAVGTGTSCWKAWACDIR